MEKVFLRTPYNYDRNEASDKSGVDCSGDEVMTKQEFAAEVDVNTIVKRFGLGGEMPADWRGLSSDAEPFDLQTAMDQVLFARESFMELPANIRSRFYNDPVRLMEFLSSEGNREEGVRLGLIRDVKKEKEEAEALQAAARRAEIERAVEVDRAVQASRGALAKG